MKFQSSDYSVNKVYISNPAKGTTISYFQIYANAIEIANKYKNFPAESLLLILLRDEELLLSTIIACWINNHIPAVYSPNLTEKEFRDLNNLFSFSAVLAHDNFVIPGFNNVFESLKFNFNLKIDEFAFEFCEDRIALVLFSSGTTGQPKAIPLSLNNINSNISEFTSRLNISKSNKFVCASPIWHAHGLYNSFITAFLLNTEVIYAGQLNIMNVNVLLKEAMKCDNTVFHITPSMIPILLAIAKKIPSSELPAFYKVICGTSFLDLNSKRAFEDVFKISIIQQYGMTETLFIAINEEFSLSKEASVGRPLDNTKLEIWDEKILDNYVEGAIRLQSSSWFGKYYSINNSENDDNYFYTGDLGYMDADGCLFVTGRIKDLIKKGGFSISSNEITNNILKIDGVIDAYTMSVIDDKLGEEIYSFYVSSLDIPKNLFLKELSKSISLKLLPKEFYRINNIIKTDTGKVSKLKMKELLDKLLSV